MKQLSYILSLLSFLLILSASSCVGKNAQRTDEKSTTDTTRSNELPEPSPFSADSAYLYLTKQLSFGPRVPNTPSHLSCSKYLHGTLEGYGLSTTTQEVDLKAFDGTILKARNIIGSYNPDASRRILLFAHWDTRPWADYDPDPARRMEPIDGADDGASGVAVLLEVARLLKQVGLDKLGVDIAFFDAEDYGVPDWEQYEGSSEATWALGTQYWSREAKRSGYTADFGILLDMVGAKGATFHREYFSQEYAAKYTTLIWDTAKRLGHDRYFINKMGGAVTDDHVFVIKNLGIPAVDIINYNPESTNGFGDYWHTHSDNIDNIDRETLQAVGETVWQVLVDYNNSLH